MRRVAGGAKAEKTYRTSEVLPLSHNTWRYEVQNSSHIIWRYSLRRQVLAYPTVAEIPSIASCSRPGE
jgi:hypothetical protein